MIFLLFFDINFTSLTTIILLESIAIKVGMV